MEKRENEKLYNLRHSAAHLAAQAVLELYPTTKLTIGPVKDEGFFYDFKMDKTLSEEDLPIIEQKMHELAKQDFKIVGKEISKEEAKKLFKDNPYKLEIINDVEDPISIYTQGNFVDLCKGGHVNSTSEIKYFKLTAVSGSYWRADKTKDALQRIYGIAFETQNDLEKYLQRLEDAKLYDHRKIGKQLDLFSFHDEAAGFPFFHDKGLRIYNKLIEFSRYLQSTDYSEVKTPLIMNEKLWKISGHYDNYKNNMYFTTIDEEANCIKPMNCPGGIMVYNEKPHSYRELPLRMAEFGFVHRHELSGVLHGLFRVRGFTQDDAHIFCTEAQLLQEVEGVINFARKLYGKFGFEKVKMAIATRPEKSIGTKEGWDFATEALKKALTNQGYEFRIKEGEGAFYGPKVEMLIEDAMGRDWQCGTVQIDFFLPQNFKQEYIDSDQSRKVPVMIHRAIYGSLERFMGIVLEHYKGKLPFWLSPVQVRILTITQDQQAYGKEIFEQLSKNGIYVELDDSNDKISAKVRDAQLAKIPWMFVVGKKEQESKTITLRHSDGQQEADLTLDALIARAKELMKF
ncbi:TPA: threonine--tRNA ligase [Candidatus Dependentiae bacterium]|nr:MAG: Threonine-tRNA ligase [candidate division TM6 bacterium GW2011_GWE2_31_21]KKP52962.1 MAG: Threonine-tRNA ligase [candidate division TM6 bacterium GW2011_GWF2_33_332]HBS47800.1 threonine--tRNA ligase [Candidatus Dependentiae bacterium]HBZ73224.1 threonine--tRNA ligase [Candidatus Dependentiae bacterium]